MKRLFVLCIVLLVSIGQVEGATVTYNARQDFSDTNNPNGVWSYGHTTSLGGVMTVFPQYLAPPTGYEGAGWVENVWYDEYGNYSAAPIVWGFGNISTPWGFVYEIKPDEIAFHPGPDEDYAIVRWTAPSDGTGNVTSLFMGQNSIGLRDIAVYHNGTQLLSVDLAGNDIRSYNDAALTVQAGDHLDFAVGPHNDYHHDLVSLKVNIDFTPVPEPSTFVLLLMGAIALLVVRRR